MRKGRDALGQIRHLPTWLMGRKVGRKWITTRTAIVRWLAQSSEHDTPARAIEHGNQHALTEALKSGKAQREKPQ